MISLKAISLVALVSLLAGCAASFETVDYGNGFKRYFSRGGVDLADCGTHLLSDLFYVQEGQPERYVSSHSERGHALHCDLSVAIIDAGATVGAANQIRRGLAAGGSSTNVSNSNTQSQGQDQDQLQVQGQTNLNVNEIKVKNIGGSESSHGGKAPHGNNGKGNGGNDGSPNGKSDNGR